AHRRADPIEVSGDSSRAGGAEVVGCRVHARVESAWKGVGQVFSSSANVPEQQVRDALDTFLNVDGSLDGSRLQTAWFPNVPSDIFISHAHADEGEARALAGVLWHHFGLRAFVDSVVWGYASTMLRRLDDKHCKLLDGSAYDYAKRNRSTSHVHMMLATALARTIDSVECVWFLNTPTSVRSSDTVERTGSPWIMHELSVVELIRLRAPRRHQTKLLHDGVKIGADISYPDITYAINIAALPKLELSNIDAWREVVTRSATRGPATLDALYDITGVAGPPSEIHG
ncbi:MAG: hypothetical protein ACHREM_25455, partial [Polyangiales bacterium]